MSIVPIFMVGAAGFAKLPDPETQPNLGMMTDKFIEFINQTQTSLHIAAYHFKYTGVSATKIIEALKTLAKRADVKLAYFDEPPRKNPNSRRILGGDSSGKSDVTPFVGTKVQTQAIVSVDVHDLPIGVDAEPIEGDGALMHSKYMIRDNSAVWMGTANFTMDGWGLQDNNVVIFDDAANLAGFYANDFNELWQNKRIAGTGKDDTGTVTVNGDSVNVDFSPGDGKSIDQAIADLAKSATKSLHIASMVISSRFVLEALVDRLNNGVSLIGVYDGPEMDNTIRLMSKGSTGKAADKVHLWNQIAPHLVRKNSKSFSPSNTDAFYNFMHNKTLVVDGKVVHTGSFNFSSNATRNAENVVNIPDAGLAGQFADYIEQLVAKYK